MLRDITMIFQVPNSKKFFKIMTVYFAIATKINALLVTKQEKTTEYGIPENYNELGEHSIVTDNEIFPYVVAILKKTTYLSAGVLIDDSWVLTAADSLFLIRESSRVIRIKLGSINHKKGGVLVPIKYFEIHPSFDDNKPLFDIALIRLAQPVTFSPNLYPIKLQTRPWNGTVSHFIVTGWQTHSKVPISQEQLHPQSMDVIKRRRLLSVSHLHQTDPEECSEQMSFSGIKATNTLMCLDPADGTDPCERQAGAPVVLNGVLWGIISSWKPEDCEEDPGLTFVTLVAAKNISTWIHKTRTGILREKKK